MANGTLRNLRNVSERAASALQAAGRDPAPGVLGEQCEQIREVLYGTAWRDQSRFFNDSLAERIFTDYLEPIRAGTVPIRSAGAAYTRVQRIIYAAAKVTSAIAWILSYGGIPEHHACHVIETEVRLGIRGLTLHRDLNPASYARETDCRVLQMAQSGLEAYSKKTCSLLGLRHTATRSMAGKKIIYHNSASANYPDVGLLMARREQHFPRQDHLLERIQMEQAAAIAFPVQKGLFAEDAPHPFQELELLAIGIKADSPNVGMALALDIRRQVSICLAHAVLDLMAAQQCASVTIALAVNAADVSTSR